MTMFANKCCFLLQLRTGTIWIAVLYILLSIGAIPLYLCQLLTHADFGNAILFITLALISVIFATLLIFGVRKNNRWLFLPFLLFIFVTTCDFVALLIYVIIHSAKWYNVLIDVGMIPINVFVFYIVMSYFVELKDSSI